MKKGEPPPKGAKELVVRLAGSNTRPTNREIQGDVQRKFGCSISPRTIARYCRDANLPSNGRAKVTLYPVDQDLLLDAKKRHCDDIVCLLESWRKNLRLAIQHFQFRINFDYEEEADSLFEGMLSHCQLVKEKYQAICEKREKYRAEKNELERAVAAEVPKGASEEFSRTVIWFAIRMEESKSQAYYKFDSDTGWLYISHLSDFAEAKGIARGSDKIQHHCQLAHERLVDKYSETEAIKEIITSVRTLRKLERDLEKAVEDTLLNQEYIVGKCTYCLPFS